MLLTHDFIQIHPRGIDPFTPHIVPFIQHTVDDLDTQMRHADLIHVRKTHGKAHCHLRPVLHNGIHFIADIARRLLHLH